MYAILGSGWTNKNWLISRFHFSFAEYSNPRNLNFGVLRVMNDDLVQPKRGASKRLHYCRVYKHITTNIGFGAHPHRDVEICTYIVEGHLTHKDSTGTEETLQRGAIQFMVKYNYVLLHEQLYREALPINTYFGRLLDPV